MADDNGKPKENEPDVFPDYCEICACLVNFKDPYCRREHINGKKHQRILNNSKILKPETAEYFMKMQMEAGQVVKEYSKNQSKRDAKLQLRLTQSLNKTTINQPPPPHKYQQTFDKCPIEIVPYLMKLDNQSLEFLKGLVENDGSKRCVELFKDKRFLPILEKNGDNMINLLYYCLYPVGAGCDIKTAFDVFYDHNTMRVYFAELVSEIYHFPFNIKYKLYRLPRQYDIKLFTQLLDIHTDKRDVNITSVCSKIDQMYQYHQMATELEQGSVTRAQCLISKNNEERSQYLEDLYREAKGMWERDTAKMA